MAENEQDLIKDFLENGSEASFQKLVEIYHAEILRFGSRMCGHREDAEDVAQETMLAAFRHMGSFRGDGSFRGWLYKIASSACLKQRRLKKDQPRYTVSLDQNEPGTDRKVQIPAGDDQDTVLTETQGLEAAKHLVEALLELPPKYRLVLTLRDFEGLSTEETAQELGLTVNNVKVRLHRARTMMKVQMLDIKSRMADQTVPIK
jgi:RNA polymerase sigma-70 factor (ECF subfamily)